MFLEHKIGGEWSAAIDITKGNKVLQTLLGSYVYKDKKPIFIHDILDNTDYGAIQKASGIDETLLSPEDFYLSPYKVKVVVPDNIWEQEKSCRVKFQVEKPEFLLGLRVQVPSANTGLKGFTAPTKPVHKVYVGNKMLPVATFMVGQNQKFNTIIGREDNIFTKDQLLKAMESIILSTKHVEKQRLEARTEQFAYYLSTL